MRRLSVFLLLLLAACRTAPLASHGRVVMLSLDGADSVTLHRLYQEGKLDAGGFARFFRDGQVAEGLQPVNPSITAVNHIALATGYAPAESGIIANDFQPPGGTLGKTVSGFSAPIATETLWEAARRQGLRVAISAWPGADGKGERRRGDWGMTYGGHGYPEAFDAELRRRGLAWPGPPDSKRLSQTWWGEPGGIDLKTWVEHDERFGTFWADALLAMADYDRWDLLMGYIQVLDDAGHELMLTDPRQPGYTPERRDELDRARTRIWQEVDRDLARLLAAVDLRTTTFLVVSDHGMAPSHTVLEPDLLLRDWGFATEADTVGQGGVSLVYVRADLPDRERILDDLRSRFLAWKVGGESPVARVLTRAEAAEIGLDHPNNGDLILLASPGYHFRSPDDPDLTAPAEPTRWDYGKHGYPVTDPAMQAVYLAIGRGVKPGHRGTVRNLDVAAEVAAWLGIEPPRRRPTAP